MGSIISRYGEEGYSSYLPDLDCVGHNGIDLVAVGASNDNPTSDNQPGRKVFAPVSGRMSIYHPDTQYWEPATNPPGYTLSIKEIPGYPELEIQLTHVYPHRSIGWVEQGVELGYYAQIGWSYAPHLHISMLWKGNVFNPEPYLSLH